MERKEQTTSLWTLIGKDQLTDALEGMQALFTAAIFQEEIVLLQGRLNDLARQIRQGIIAHNDADLSRSQIRAAMTNLIREWEKGEETPNLPSSKKEGGTTTNNQYHFGNGDNVGGDKIINN